MDNYSSSEVEEEEEDNDSYFSSTEDSSENIAHQDSFSSSPKRSNTQVITRDSLLAAQKEDLGRVMDFLSIKEHHARTLLIHYQWDVDNLFAFYVEKDKDSLFSRAGLTLFEDRHFDSSSFVSCCDVCLEDVVVSDQMTTMDCGHCFCNECWTEHFTVQINEGQSKRIRCMAHKCNAICDEDVVRKLVRVELAEKFDRFLVESYIEDNKRVKWYPSAPHCGNAIRAEDDKLCEVECSCGLQFCFSCLSESHSPCSCLMWELWSKKCRDESETMNWITVHTKLCPKCIKPVEKNGGCNVVTCICGQQFCWVCGGPFGYEAHGCGRYDNNSEIQMERAKRDLYRYTHYHHRYKAHVDSSKLEDKLRETILKKVSKSEDNVESSHIDFSWVTSGLDRLFRSRRVLSYSYAFAYYMFGDELFKDEEMSREEKDMKKNLFEDQQQQLEGNVEKLSHLLEEPFHNISVAEIAALRIQAVNFSVAVDTRCKKMYECIEIDLLGYLQRRIHNIAPYKSKGIEQAAMFCAYKSGETSTSKLSGNSQENICSPSQKRHKGEGSLGNGEIATFDLNKPS